MTTHRQASNGRSVASSSRRFGDFFRSVASSSRSHTCKDPDERGQPWRLKLVLLDMLGFLMFGTLVARKSSELMFAGAASS
jgi:hypothetical protein